MGTRKSQQLQIRVTPEEKREIWREARAAKMDLSSWVLSRVRSDKKKAFRTLVETLPEPGQSGSAYAELSDFLGALTRSEYGTAVDVPPSADKSNAVQNYVAAMVEMGAARKGVKPPRWTSEVAPLERPYFGTTLGHLRLHLMTNAPIAFRRRNIFVDSSVGDRV